MTTRCRDGKAAPALLSRGYGWTVRVSLLARLTVFAVARTVAVQLRP